MITLQLVNGLVFGIEYMDDEDNTEVSHMVVIHLAIIRICFMSFR